MTAQQIFKIAYALHRFHLSGCGGEIYSHSEASDSRAQLPAHYGDYMLARENRGLWEAAEKALDDRREAAETFRQMRGRLYFSATRKFNDAHLPDFD